MKRANLRITAESLAAMLGLKQDIQIVDAGFLRDANLVELYLHGDGLPESVNVPEACPAVFLTLADVRPNP